MHDCQTANRLHIAAGFAAIAIYLLFIGSVAGVVWDAAYYTPHANHEADVLDNNTIATADE